MMVWLLLLAWIIASFIFASLWAIAGARLTRMQELKPRRYLELDASQFRRIQ